MTIGQTVRERRRARGLSQEQLGQRVGVTLSAIQRLESGRIQDPHYSTLSGIARALDTTVAELTGESAPLVASPPPGQPSRAEQVAQDAAERAQRLTEDVPRRMQ